MPGLVPGIYVFVATLKKDVDGRDKPGHDENKPQEASRLAKNARISSRAAVVGWPASSIRCWVTTLCGKGTRAAKNGATSVLAALSGSSRPTNRSPSADA